MLSQNNKDSWKEIQEWLLSNNIEDVECIFPDLSGIARGKVIPSEKFLSGLKNNSLFIPYDTLTQMVTGHYPPTVEGRNLTRDLRMIPDAKTLRRSPWVKATKTGQIICDLYTFEYEEVNVSSRQILKNVIENYTKQGIRPVVAPEIEFFLVQKNLDPDYPLEPAKGLSGRYESGSQAYGIEALNEYVMFTDLLYNYCERSNLDVDTFLHEGGSAQLEVNFLHGSALDLADQIFLFKRTARQAALNQGMYLTFMAKPHINQPGSSMHLHQSLVDKHGQNIFSDPKKKYSEKFFHFIGGLQKYLPEASIIMYPNVNSYRRIRPDLDTPINVSWGFDNRTVGLRVPIAEPKATRVENRLPGSDVNPYLSFAVSLLAGFVGMEEKIACSKESSELSEQVDRTIPYHLYEALQIFEESKMLKKNLGENFVKLYKQVKNDEIEMFSDVVTTWEREHLLLIV